MSQMSSSDRAVATPPYARKEIEVGYPLLVVLTLNRQAVCASGTCSILHRASTTKTWLNTPAGCSYLS